MRELIQSLKKKAPGVRPGALSFSGKFCPSLELRGFRGNECLKIVVSIAVGGDFLIRIGKADLPLAAATGRQFGRRELHIAQVADHFQHFAASGEHPAAFALVLFHGVHEVDLLDAVVAFASGGVNLATTLNLLAPFQTGGQVLARVARAPVRLATPIDGHFLVARLAGLSFRGFRL